MNSKITEQIINITDLDNFINQINYSNEMQFYWLGKQPYHPIWELQKELHSKRVSGEINDIVLMLEHDHVYTFGKNANKDLLLDSKPDNVEIVQIDRGGEVTYHGPGQLVCYPIIDLHNFKMSISWYMRKLENVIAQYLEDHKIIVNQKPGLTGVWVADEKICAMGVRLSRWVTMHGFALNVKPKMEYFDGMIPCGIFEYGVTSLHELGINVEMDHLVKDLVTHFINVFLGIDNEI